MQACRVILAEQVIGIALNLVVTVVHVRIETANYSRLLATSDDIEGGFLSRWGRCTSPTGFMQSLATNVLADITDVLDKAA